MSSFRMVVRGALAALALAAVAMPPAAEAAEAPAATFARAESGWLVTLAFPRPVTAISWSMDDSGAFEGTGFLDTSDPRTPFPNPKFKLRPDTPATTIFVRYVDQTGSPAGPFPIKFDPAVETGRAQRRILELTARSWLAFAEYNGLILHFSHLAAHRCAIRELRIGVDSAVPDVPVELPPCDVNDPTAIPANFQSYLSVPASTKYVTAVLTFGDGTTSEVKTFRR